MTNAKRLFIVEDEGIVAADLQDRLTAMGYTVTGRAASGESAVEQITVIQPDLVLMDIMLEGAMDGIRAAQIVQDMVSVPVVFLTAHADDATMRRAAGTGPFGYVLKPFDERELHLAVEIGLYRHHSEKRLRDLNRQLQAALDQVRVLRGLLPICAWCKKVRNDHGYWETVESYIRSNSEVQITHSICPQCFAQQESQLFGKEEPGVGEL